MKNKELRFSNYKQFKMFQLSIVYPPKGDGQYAFANKYKGY